jgi:hypothetical protein
MKRDLLAIFDRCTIAPTDTGLEDCWLWGGHVRVKDGYANADFGRKYPDGAQLNEYVHRVAYEIAYGEVPAGLVVDHLCRVRHCANPMHLEAVTQKVNIARAARRTPKTVCKHGHPLVEAGVDYYDYDGHRVCKPCHKQRTAAYQARRKDQVSA